MHLMRIKMEPPPSFVKEHRMIEKYGIHVFSRGPHNKYVVYAKYSKPVKKPEPTPAVPFDCIDPERKTAIDDRLNRIADSWKSVIPVAPKTVENHMSRYVNSLCNSLEQEYGKSWIWNYFN